MTFLEGNDLSIVSEAPARRSVPSKVFSGYADRSRSSHLMIDTDVWPRVPSIPAAEAWARVQRGEARLLDLRTELERRRYGWPPGAQRVALAQHVVRPGGPDTIYLCQHANRSKLTGRRGASEVRDGWQGWLDAGLPVERT